MVSLSDLLRVLRRERRRLTPAAAVAIALRVLDALEVRAHDGARGDLSPEVVQVDRSGAVRFGTTSAPPDRALRYLAPEQARRHPIDGRADLYAVGVLLWEMLTGVGLVRGSTRTEILDAVRAPAPPTPPSHITHEAAGALDTIVVTLLAAEANDRPKSVAEARHRLISAMPDALSVTGAELGSLVDNTLVEVSDAPALLPPTPAPLLEPAPRADVRAMVDALTLAHNVVTPTPHAMGRDASQVRGRVQQRRDARLIALFAVASAIVALMLAMLVARA